MLLVDLPTVETVGCELCLGWFLKTLYARFCVLAEPRNQIGLALCEDAEWSRGSF